MRIPLHLHIGHPKVASSSIQVALAQNLDALRTEGFLVADANLCFPETGPLHGFPITLVAELCERKEAGLREAAERFAAAQQQIGNRKLKLVVSSESMAIPEAEYIAKALRHAFEIHVIYYVRRQEEWLVSAWNQWGSKEGLNLVDYCNKLLAVPFPDYDQVAQRWEAVADSMHVRPLHTKALVGGDIVLDFFAAIGSKLGITPPDPVNQSFDLALLEVFQDSSFLFASADDNSLREWLRDVIPEGFPIEKPILDTDLLQRIRNSYDRCNRALHARHFPQLPYEAVFGPRRQRGPDGQLPEDQRSPEAQIERLRRVAGLQFALLFRLSEQVRQLRANKGA